MNRNPDQLLKAEELGDYLGLTKQQLALMRVNGTGPRFFQASANNIRYRWGDVTAWIEANSHESTDEYTNQPGTYHRKATA
ncbi:helix-turn-helix transcriptional regulator [Corynebacterium coyleae]|uniref:helix-turn-helix transcriptional regulator n=1 Tax=Corynebacterium coyleae TaxID=53374 RepID=UPI00254A76E2|nr:DNA-binding protein [Corynebacterium coyleae]MDK8664155.1 DNA-binding protein [Corynebacterium coyleae]MDK8707207.1 DNA-binding protein [Corynebacterium coyleae]MDK8734151.1 DNA-binding protein [Corynebacterium coyleae]MDK8893251.1 DNA-binding protein [Corynebacterium coyleae]